MIKPLCRARVCDNGDMTDCGKLAVRSDRCALCIVDEVEDLLAEVKASENRIATARARIAELSGEVQEKNVYDDIQTERFAQRRVYGIVHDDELSPVQWVFLICRHATQAIQEHPFDLVSIFRRQMVRVAALAVAAVEAVDRAREAADKKEARRG